MLLPDADTVIELHEIVLNVSGGQGGVHDIKLIISAVERPKTFVEYIDNYDTDTVCALLIDGIARYHGFKDGNKRTALMVAIFTYRLNKVHFKATESMNTDFDELVMWVVKKKPEIEAIRGRLKQLRKLYEGEEESWANLLVTFIKQALNHGKK